MTPISVQYENARYDIAVFLWDMPQGLAGTIEYSTDLFDESTISLLMERYECVLRWVVETPDASLDDLVARLAQSDQEARTTAEQTFAKSMKSKLKSIKRRRTDTPDVASDTGGPSSRGSNEVL